MDEFQEQQILQQQQIDNSPDTIYADNLREEKIANIISQLDPDNVLTDMEHRLRGEKKVSGNNWIPIYQNKKPVSEELISDAISFAGAFINQSTVMGNLSTDEINGIMSQIVIPTVRDSLIVKAKDYGIDEQYQEWSRIGHIICASIFIVLKRSWKGSESNKIFRMLKVTENVGGTKKNKLRDNLKFW